MVLLCLLLGFLSGVSAVGSSTVTDPTISAVTTEAPVTTKALNPTVAQPGTTTPSVITTVAKTVSSIITTPPAPQISTIPTPTRGATTGAPSTITSLPVTHSSEITSAATKQATTPILVAATSQHNASTAGNSITSPLGSSKHPDRIASTEPSQVSNATKADLKSTTSATVTEMSSPGLTTNPPKDTKISTPDLGSSAAPPPKTTPSTPAGGNPAIITTKSATPQLPRSSSSVPRTEVVSSTHKDISPQNTTESKNIKKLEENIEVECSNTKNNTSYVKIKMDSSAICDKNVQATGDIQAIIMQVCKAIKPGYQATQDKCNIQLLRINEKELAITGAFIESHTQPKDLYTQLKRNGANFSLFSYDGADPEDEDVVSIPLISAIVSLAVLLLIIAAAYGCWHQRKARKREQRLTEELQTMENGYHDNPTLEVMETAPEMQEKKGGPNGELGDSWIVPLDNLTREDLEEEEDTHL